MSLNDSASSAHLAALTLHALVQSDRDWLLDRVTPAQAQRLRALLAELSALGIPQDPELLNSARHATQLRTQRAADASWVNLSPAAWHGLLRDEPSWFCAYALTEMAPDALSLILESWPQPFRAELQQALSDTARLRPPALLRAVREVLQEAKEAGNWVEGGQ